MIPSPTVYALDAATGSAALSATADYSHLLITSSKSEPVISGRKCDKEHVNCIVHLLLIDSKTFALCPDVGIIYAAVLK
jgi:hypothetical protein